MVVAFKEGEAKVGILDKPNELRFNRQKGLIAVGNLKNKADEANNSRGTWIEGLILSVDFNLYGIIGQARPKDWIYVSILLIDAEDSRLRKGWVYSFLMTGLEADDVIKNENTLDLEHEMNLLDDPDMVRPVTKLKIVMPEETTKVGDGNESGEYYYPVLSFELADNKDDYTKAARIVLEQHLDKLPNPLDIFPSTMDETGQLTGGLISTQESYAQLEKGDDDHAMLESA